MRGREQRPDTRVLPRQTYRCDHCRAPGTTGDGALWKTTPGPHAPLYYLHSRCLLPYKARHGLQSVEGRLPRVSARAQREVAVVRAEVLVAGG